MSYRVQINIVIFAANKDAAHAFSGMVEDFVADTFTKDTACITTRVESALGADGQ